MNQTNIFWTASHGLQMSITYLQTTAFNLKFIKKSLPKKELANKYVKKAI